MFYSFRLSAIVFVSTVVLYAKVLSADTIHVSVDHTTIQGAREFALLQGYLKQARPFYTIMEQIRQMGRSPTQEKRNRLRHIHDFNSNLRSISINTASDEGHRPRRTKASGKRKDNRPKQSLSFMISKWRVDLLKSLEEDCEDTQKGRVSLVCFAENKSISLEEFKTIQV